MITQERLKELAHYDAETGVFTRRVTTSPTSRVGYVIGSPNNQGYLLGMLDSVRYKMHRLAWLYVYGKMPNDQIDHINRVKSDNRIENLRPATNSQNNKNRKQQENNTSGLTGITLRPEGSWRARINTDKGRLHLGDHKDYFEACCARKSAELKHGYHPNHGRVV